MVKAEIKLFSFLSTADPKCYPCKECGEMFKSKVALRRHETYVCKNENAIFATKPRMEKEERTENIHNFQR